MASQRSAAEVIQDARDAYTLVQRAYRDYMEVHGRERTLGLRNLVIWGRILTNTLQKLKSVVANRSVVKAWWKPFSEELENDPEFKYLYDFRNQIDHEGLIGSLSSRTVIKDLSSDDMRSVRPPAPFPSAAFFMGDPWGGSGWSVTRDDGTVDKFYVSLPPEWTDRVANTLHFTEPTTSQGVAPPAGSIEAILTRYVAYLGEILDDATQRFAK